PTTHRSLPAAETAARTQVHPIQRTRPKSSSAAEAPMPGRSRIIPVPYFAQPTGITCQSTCLKMMATYLEQSVVRQSTGAADRDIEAIWKDINEGTKRPVQMRNAHKNMKWWLEVHFPSLHFEYITTTDEARAVESIVRFIDGGFPVMVAVSHVNVEGHIILVVGYENYQPYTCSA